MIAKLRSMSDAVEYIKYKLGSPVMNVEMTNAQLQQEVIDAVQLFHRYMYGESVYQDIVTFELKAGQRSYPMPDDVVDAVELHTNYSGDVNELFTAEHQILMETGILPQILQYMTGNSTGMELSGYDIATKHLELMKRFFSKTFVVNYHPLRRELVVQPTPKINLYGVIILWKKEKLENCVDHPHVKRLMVALAKQTYGGILGKYQLSLPGGGTITGAELKQEGREDYEKIIEIMADEQEPLEFYVG